MGPAKSQPLQLDCILVPKTLNCLQEDIREMEQCVKQIQKYVEVREDELSMRALISNDGDTPSKNEETFEQKGLEAVTDIKDLHRAFTSLAGHYVSLTGQLRNMSPGMLDASTEQDSSSPVPEQKLGMPIASPQAGSLNTFLSSGDGSFDLSLTTGSESLSSFSSPSSDSGSESYTLSNRRCLAHVSKGNEEQHKKIVESQTPADMNGKHKLVEELSGGDMLNENSYAGYDELLEEVANFEKELKVKNRVPLRDLQNELEPSYVDDGEAENEKTMVSKLQKQIAELESHLLDSQRNNVVLIEELDRTRKMLQSSEENMAKLEHKLRNETHEVTRKLQGELDVLNQKVIVLEAELSSESRLNSELQEQVVKFTNDLTNRDREVEELQAALCDAQQNFTKERLQLLFDVSVLSQQQDLLQGRLEEAESRTKLVQDQVKQCQLESMDLKTSHEAQGEHLLGEIEELKAELAQRCETIGALNQSLDAHNYKYDMLMAEKDETVAKLNTLTAELRHLFIQIKQMEAHFKELTGERVELLAASENAEKLVDELRLRVMELEKEVDQQREVISEREEEKREAIRQLCSSLEHYRCGYHELRQAFVGSRRLAAAAS